MDQGHRKIGHERSVTAPYDSPVSGRQAEVLTAVIDVISRNAQALNITGYINHTLRDARSAGSGLFDQFGLMTDDYTPKPAFHVYRDLIDAHHLPGE
jgi:hypothetical protein